MHYMITNGAVSFGADTVLENIDFEIRDREKIAVVGRNGCGKSTLLKAITGEVELEKGTGEKEFSVSSSGNVQIGYLKQIAFSDDSVTLIDEILKVFKPIFDIENEMAQLLEKIEKTHLENDIKRYTDLSDRYDFLGGYTYKKEYSVMIKKFGFTESEMLKPLSEFSGGQRTKIAFMKLLLSKPDLLLLDEPTNHLDISTVKWLEDYLKNYRSAVVIVSHDRMFLNRIVNKVYEIEYGETTRYVGNYSEFERLKRISYEKRLKDHELQQKEIARIERLIERFRYKATKAKMVQSKIKMLERMKLSNAPNRYDMRTFHTNFQPEIDDVKTVFSCKNLTIGYNKPLMTLDFELLRGQKLGIIGDNGIGKSTLLKTVMGIIPQISGDYSFGMKSKIGYFDQKMAEITGEESVFDNFRAEFPALTDTEVRSSLAAFLFSGEDVFKSINVLSGGERVRLELCKMFKRRPNLLILDEPTNHMDIVGKETLENILKEYNGSVIFVSHDRYFVNKIADKILFMGINGNELFDGTYSEFEEKHNTEQPNENVNSQNSTKNHTSKKGFTTPLKERSKKERRANRLEELIEELGAEIDTINASLANPQIFSDYEKVSELEAELKEKTELSDSYMEEWSEITDWLAQNNI